MGVPCQESDWVVDANGYAYSYLQCQECRVRWNYDVTTSNGCASEQQRKFYTEQTFGSQVVFDGSFVHESCTEEDDVLFWRATSGRECDSQIQQAYRINRGEWLTAGEYQFSECTEVLQRDAF